MKEKVFYYLFGIILVIVLLLCFFVFGFDSDEDSKSTDKSDGNHISNTDNVKDSNDDNVDKEDDDIVDESIDTKIDFTFNSKTTPLDNTIMILEIIKDMDECNDTYKIELAYVNYYMKYQINDKSNYNTKEDREVLALQKKLVIAIDELLEEESKSNIDGFKLVFKEYSKMASKGGN